jgi:hypothetical protein
MESVITINQNGRSEPHMTLLERRGSGRGVWMIFLDDFSVEIFMDGDL